MSEETRMARAIAIVCIVAVAAVYAAAIYGAVTR